MIRVNLLPGARKKRGARTTVEASANSTTWAAIYFASAVVLAIGLAIFYFRLDGQLEEQQRQNAELTSRTEELRAKSAKLEEVEAALAKSARLEQVVAELHRARTGPVRVLVELGRILSKGGGPTVDPVALERLRRSNPLAGYDATWDVRRLWLTEFRESDRSCKIAGLGRTNEDVAELLRRLSLSELFEEVTLTKTLAANDTARGLSLTSFELTCKVRY